MYLCKRKANKFRNLATLIFLNIAILGCSFSPVNSDSEIIENESYEDIETENNSPKFYNEKKDENKFNNEERNFSSFNDEEKTDFLRQKAIHDFKNKNYNNFTRSKINNDSSEDSSSLKKSNKKNNIPSLNELKNMDEVPFVRTNLLTLIQMDHNSHS